jgi:hypothetical protein
MSDLALMGLDSFNPNLIPDGEQAARFITALTGDPNTKVTWQLFDDTKGRKLPALIRVLHGSLAEVWDSLTLLNMAGAGIYVTVNELKGAKRSVSEIKSIRAIYADFDGENAINDAGTADLFCPANIIVESSPGKRHLYWTLDPIQPGVVVDDFRGITEAIVEKYHSDNNAKDAARVLRVPGFYHRKGEPVMSRLLHADNNRTNAQKVIEGLGLDVKVRKPRTKATPRVVADRGGVVADRGGVVADFDPLEYLISPGDEARLRAALTHIDAGNREHWIAVGAALSRSGETGFAIFHDWSKTGAGYVDEADCRAKFEEFIPSTRSRFPAVFTLAMSMGYRQNEEGPIPEPEPEKLMPRCTEYLIDGLIGDGVTLIAGGTGVGKSTMLVPLLSMITGELSSFGSGIEVFLKRKVMVFAEDPNQISNVRYGLQEHEGLVRVPGRFLVAQAARHTPEAWQERLAALTEEHTIDGPNGYRVKPLFVFDTSNANFEIENENDSAGVGRVMSALKQCGAPIWVIGHLAKALLRADLDDLTSRGSGAWEADAQGTAYVFTPDPQSTVRHLAIRKVRFEPAYKEIQFETHVGQVELVSPWGQHQTVRYRYGIPVRSSREDRAELTKAKQIKIRDGVRQQIKEALLEQMVGKQMFKVDIARLTTIGSRDDRRLVVDDMIAGELLVPVTIASENGTMRTGFKLNDNYITIDEVAP